jgi:hypothetical protein
MVFEIPFRYQSQILIFVLPDQTDSFSVYSIPTSGDIKEIDERQVSYHDYLQMMSNPEIIGHQIVLAFNINSADTPNSVPGDGRNDAELNTLVSSLNAGEAVSAPLKGLLAAPTAWVGESFFKK